jgi:pimeloyl-ACP methyl ester carboxylesterase
VTSIEYADTPDGRLAYVRQGSGDPLLLVMGVAGHHRMWGQGFLDRLAERFDVVAFDHRGIGRSRFAEQPFTITDLAEDAVAVLDHLGWESAHVIGISMGGVVAQELALNHPARVRRLVLGCTWSDPDGAWAPGVGNLAEAASSGDPLTAARLMFEANVSPAFAAGPGRFEEFTGEAAAETVPAPVVLMQMQAAASYGAEARLGALAPATLVVHGTADDVIRTAAGERLAASIPGARLDLLDGAGHLFFWEQPDRAADTITAHLIG